jgi:hypothetical protein
MRPNSGEKVMQRERRLRVRNLYWNNAAQRIANPIIASDTLRRGGFTRHGRSDAVCLAVLMAERTENGAASKG